MYINGASCAICYLLRIHGSEEAAKPRIKVFFSEATEVLKNWLKENSHSSRPPFAIP